MKVKDFIKTKTERTPNEGLGLGDKVYRIVSFGVGATIHTYEVVEVREQIDGSFQYAVECESCSDHEKCLVLISKHEENSFRFIKMLNNDGQENDGYHNSRNFQYEHNTDDGMFYSKTKKEAAKFLMRKLVSTCEEEIQKYNNKIHDAKIAMAKYIAVTEAMED